MKLTFQREICPFEHEIFDLRVKAPVAGEILGVDHFLGRMTTSARALWQAVSICLQQESCGRDMEKGGQADDLRARQGACTVQHRRNRGLGDTNRLCQPGLAEAIGPHQFTQHVRLGGIRKMLVGSSLRGAE